MTISPFDLELLIFPTSVSILFLILYSIGKKRAKKLAAIGIYRMPPAFSASALIVTLLCAIYLTHVYHRGFIPWLTLPLLSLFIALMTFISVGGLFYRIHLGEHKIEEKGAFSVKTASYSDVNTLRVVQGRYSRRLIVEYARNGHMKLPEVQLFDQMYLDIQNRVNMARGITQQ